MSYSFIVLIPFRSNPERDKQLKILKKFLSKYDIKYKVIEDNSKYLFNRGLILNKGVIENNNYDYYIFHDVDLIPDKQLLQWYFQIPTNPIHIGYRGHRYTYKGYIGGILSILKTDFYKVNGFPNNFFGWGGEDDALYNRIIINKLHITIPKHGSVMDLEQLNNEQKSKQLQGLKNNYKIEQIEIDKYTWYLNGINQYNLYKNLKSIPIINIPLLLNYNKINLYNNHDLMVNNYIKKVYESGYILDNIPVKDATDPLEGKILYNIIKDNNNNYKTLEIGFAYGFSSMYICQALKDIHSKNKHVIIDPFQKANYNNIGIYNMKQCPLNNYVLHEDLSEIILPQLLKKEKKFDFIYIDGLHTFENTLIDFYFCDKLLNINGIIIIDDFSWSSIKKVIKFVKNNYKNYIILEGPTKTNIFLIKQTMTLRKFSDHKTF